MQIVKALHICDEVKFTEECNKYLEQGYKLHSSGCGFVNSAEYDFCPSYHAILVKDESLKFRCIMPNLKEAIKRRGK